VGAADIDKLAEETAMLSRAMKEEMDKTEQLEGDKEKLHEVRKV
jgi:hypothetical protein